MIDRHDNFCAGDYLVKATGSEAVFRNFGAHTRVAYTSYPFVENYALKSQENNLVAFNNKIFVGRGFLSGITPNEIGVMNKEAMITILFPKLKVGVFPNPTQQSIHINNLERKSSIRFYNVLSQSIKTENLQKGNKQIDVQEMAAGHYFYEISNKINKEKYLIQNCR